MKRILLFVGLILFFVSATAQVASVNTTDKNDVSVMRFDGIVKHKSFVINREIGDYTMYVEFVTANGRKYSMPTIFATWELPKNGYDGYIELFKDSVFEGFPSLTFSLSEQPYFWKQLKIK